MATREEQLELLRLLEEQERRLQYKKLDYYFTDTGWTSRDNYKKHIMFINAGKDHRQRLFLAGNRSGKTVTGAYEVATHAIGKYPHWWEGRKFHKPVKIICAGISAAETKRVMQEVLLGPPHDIGSGMIPKEAIIETLRRPGIPEAISVVRIRHSSGGISTLEFMSYEQGRESFQGSQPDIIWLDEEPPANSYGIYTECLTRTATNNGMVLCTFTPFFGVTDLIANFLPNGVVPDSGIYDTKGKFFVSVSWRDLSLEHLPQDARDEMASAYTPFERDARMHGLPFSATGLVYQMHRDEYEVNPFTIPDTWPRAYGFDCGNRTAVIWGAQDPNTGVIYLYDEYYRTIDEDANIMPATHAHAINSRGKWIPGVIDPKGSTARQYDRTQLFRLYEELGLDLALANNSVDVGILTCWQALSTGRVKAFSTLKRFFLEISRYRRDEKGEIVKKMDDMMDAWRYLMMSGMDRAVSYYEAVGDDDDDDRYSKKQLGASPVTGY